MRRLWGLTRRGQLAATFGHDPLVVPLKPGLRRDVADAAVQAHIIVLVYKVCHNVSVIFQAERRQGSPGVVHPCTLV